MKLLKLFIFMYFVCGSHLFGQRTTHIVKNGENINVAIPPSDRFQYPDFTTGHVVFKDGKVVIIPLNYNRVLGEIQFINSTRDTLSIANEATLHYITINNDSFFYDKKYLQLVDGNSSLKLAKNVTYKLSDIKKPAL